MENEELDALWVRNYINGSKVTIGIIVTEDMHSIVLFIVNPFSRAFIADKSFKDLKGLYCFYGVRHHDLEVHFKTFENALKFINIFELKLDLRSFNNVIEWSNIVLGDFEKYQRELRRNNEKED